MIPGSSEDATSPHVTPPEKAQKVTAPVILSESPRGTSSGSTAESEITPAAKTTSVGTVNAHSAEESPDFTRKIAALPRMAMNDPAIEAMKADLLGKCRSPRSSQAPLLRQALSEDLPHDPTIAATAGTPDNTLPLHIVPDSLSDRYTGPTQISEPGSRTSGSKKSVDQVALEIDLLPRSPLVDTATPVCSPRPAQSEVISLGAYPSLAGLDFQLDGPGRDLLLATFPPMLTREEEEAERVRQVMDAQDWGDMPLQHVSCPRRTTVASG
jgi:hypothetical protein